MMFICVAWFGLFSSGPRCRCGAEISPAEITSYAVQTPKGPVLRCEDCWAAAQPKAEQAVRKARAVDPRKVANRN